MKHFLGETLTNLAKKYEQQKELEFPELELEKQHPIKISHPQLNKKSLQSIIASVQEQHMVYRESFNHTIVSLQSPSVPHCEFVCLIQFYHYHFAEI